MDGDDALRQIQMTVRSLKGPALSVLMLMLWARRWHGPVWEVKELTTGTGYDGEAIAKARATLIGLRLAEAANGLKGLRLIDRAVQQLDFMDVLPPVGEVIDGAAEARSENPMLSGSSSLSSYKEGDDGARGNGTLLRSENPIHPELQLLPTERRSENPIYAPPMHPALESTARWLVDRLGCASYAIAKEAITAALDEGMEPIDIKHEALWWWVYCASGSMKTVPQERWGFFIARKIQDGTFVYEGYQYNEQKAKEVNIDLWHEFLEVQHVVEARQG